MYLIQLLLPVQDEQGLAFERTLFQDLEQELTDRFGGLTAYRRAPATGLWEEPSGHTVQDQIVVYEVMAAELATDWWAAFRQRLERLFAQDELVVRAHLIQRL